MPEFDSLRTVVFREPGVDHLIYCCVLFRRLPGYQRYALKWDYRQDLSDPQNVPVTVTAASLSDAIRQLADMQAPDHAALSVRDYHF